MSKRKQTKSAKIRAYAAEHPKAGPTAIAAALAASGVKVSPGHVSSALRSAKAKRPGVPSDTLAGLLAAKAFVKRAGGIEPAKLALTTLGKLLAS